MSIPVPPSAVISPTLNRPIDGKGISNRTFDTYDSLVQQGRFDDAINLLKSQANWQDNEHALSRIAKAEFEKAKSIKSTNPSQYKKLLSSSLDNTKKALAKNPSEGPVNKLAAVILRETGSNLTPKQAIAQVEQISQHLQKSGQELDAHAHYLMGEFQYARASPNWFSRTILNPIFGQPASNEKETALGSFKQAESIEPGFLTKNKLMIAKLLLELKKDDGNEAKRLLQDIANSTSQDPNDVACADEAKKLLKTVGQ